MVKVLLVDDEELVRRVVRVVLEAEGHDVLEAGDGGAALSALRDGRPDVVVLDLIMPGEDGVDVCRRIKRSNGGARVLVLTSLPPDEAKSQCADAGADDFMVKPFSPLELIRRVSALADTA